MADGEILEGLDHLNPSVDSCLFGIRKWRGRIDKMTGEQREEAERAFVCYQESVRRVLDNGGSSCDLRPNELAAWQKYWREEPAEV